MSEVKAVSTSDSGTEQLDEKYFLASQWALMSRKFRRHRLALLGGGVLAALYLVALFPEFLSPYDPRVRSPHIYLEPQRVHFVDAGGRFHLHPFVYGLTRGLDERTLERIYTENTAEVFPIRFFVRGFEYRVFGLIPSNLHLFGVEGPATIFLSGTDNLGRDFFSRTIHATRVSLSVGFVGVVLSFVLGSILGGLSGYYGGTVDMIVQRVIEFLLSIPKIPLWMALAAALPIDWPVVKVYFGITIILSAVGWTGLARVVRGKLLQLRGEDFCLAAKIAGAGDRHIVARHLLPSVMSYLIVSLTLAVPGMILAETSLSFLGIGLRAPAISWGVLLQDAQNIRTVALYPWLLWFPALLIIVTVLAFNFMGDGLRDAADPYR